MIMKSIDDVKSELKEMYPQLSGFIEHTLVAEMCIKWHEKQENKLDKSGVISESEDPNLIGTYYYNDEMTEEKYIRADERTAVCSCHIPDFTIENTNYCIKCSKPIRWHE